MKLSERLEQTRKAGDLPEGPECCYEVFLRRRFPMRYLMLRTQRVLTHSKNCRCMEHPSPCAGGLPG